MSKWHNKIGKPLSSLEWLETHHNAKLIERKGFAQIICQQDTIIRLQKLQIKEYNNIVVDMQSRIIDANKYNEELNTAIERQRKKNKILVGTTCGALAVTVLVLLIK